MSTHWSAEIVFMPAEPQHKLEKIHVRVDPPGADLTAAAAELAKHHPDALGLHFVRHDDHGAWLGTLHLSFYVTDRPDPIWYFLHGREVGVDELPAFPSARVDPEKVADLRRRGFRRALVFRNVVAERAARHRGEAPRQILDFIGLDDRAVVLPNHNLERDLEAPIPVDQTRSLDRHGKDNR